MTGMQSAVVAETLTLTSMESSVLCTLHGSCGSHVANTPQHGSQEGGHFSQENEVDSLDSPTLTRERKKHMLRIGGRARPRTKRGPTLPL
eukprot:scaffold133432_cov32-Tisochrysis_lutea.AAC.2